MSIGGRKKIILNPESILKLISEYDIFKMYMPHSWKINEATISPFPREKGIESNPSFIIGNRKGNINFLDFADNSKRGDCFTFVKMYKSLGDMNDVLRLIDADFNLGISNGKKSAHKKIIKEYKQPEEKGKRYALVQVKTRRFNNDELAYWNEFHQDIQDLKDNNVYAIDKVYLNRKLFSVPRGELMFGYLYDSHWKIYRPHASRKLKWVPNNVPITAMDGKLDIVNCDTAFINKSKKDHMVVKKLLEHSCAVQNEGIACFSEENVKYIKDNSKRQILSFDSDVAGVKNSLQITKVFGFDYCNVPRKYKSEGIKDWADLARERGMSAVENYFKKQNLI
jgi:hypothetical protein